jgi:hypothetical protein
MKFNTRWLASLLLGIMASCGAVAPHSAFAQTPQAANWFQIGAGDGQIVSSANPAALQVCGDAQHCTAVVTVSSWPITITWGGAKTVPVWGADPQPYTGKVIGVIQTAQAQTFIVDGAPRTVPALATAPPPPAYYTSIYSPGAVYKLVYSNVGVIPGAPAAALISAVNLPPYDLMAAVLQNLTARITLNGVVFDCTFGFAALDGTVSQNCIPEPIPAAK